jgi:extradiol dioxygenase family protein
MDLLGLVGFTGIIIAHLLRPKSKPKSSEYRYDLKEPFHLAIPVHDMTLTREFYGGVLGLTEGRRHEDKWQDYSFFGHQLVCHFVGATYRCSEYFNPVDGDEVPVPHFGAVLTSKEQFDGLIARLEKAKVQFVIAPTLRFAGAPGEQWTCFFKDPSNNALEFKYMSKPENLFAKYNVHK